eukprot:Mrub_04195.p1 GENE.Mrub_04195~~Mrub_04195.p1  ORF type:complete len:425 (+),score=29.60 Mrub_04195:2-1276(+)
MYLQIILNFFGGNKFDTSLTYNDNDTYNYDNSLDYNYSSVTTSSDSSSRETTSYENMLNDIFEQQGSVYTEAKVNADLNIDMQDNIVVGLNESEVSFVYNSDRMILISFVSIVIISVVALIVVYCAGRNQNYDHHEQKTSNNNVLDISYDESKIESSQNSIDNGDTIRCLKYMMIGLGIACGLLIIFSIYLATKLIKLSEFQEKIIRYDQIGKYRDVYLNEKIQSNTVLISNLTNIIVKLEQKNGELEQKNEELEQKVISLENNKVSTSVLNNNISLYHLPFRDIRIQNNFVSKRLITIDLNDYYTSIPETAISIDVEIFMTKADSDGFGSWTFGYDFPSIYYWNDQTQISNVNHAWLGLQHENVPTYVSHILDHRDQNGGWKSTNIPIKNNQFNILGYDGGSGNYMSYIIINIKGYRVKHEYD